MKRWHALAILAAVAAWQGRPAFAQEGKHSGDSYTPQQAASLVKETKRSLAEAIAAAERHCGGRAIHAEFCRKDGASSGIVGKVVVVVGDNRLVEATVNPESGEVSNQRDLDRMTYHASAGSGETTVSIRMNDFAMARRWQKSSDLTGKKITNPSGEDLGKLEEIVVDANSGRILYGVLSFGGVLGVGDKLFAIPWSSLSLTSDYKSFVLDIDKDRLKTASGFDKGQWPNFADEQWATETYKYYNQTPYWRTEIRSEARGDGARQASDVNYRERWRERPTVWQKATDLSRKDVRNLQNEDLGKMNDLAIDPDSGRVLYGILSFRGKLFAVPWNALNLSNDGKQFTLNVDKEALKDSVSFTSDKWPNMTDPRWAGEIHTHYHVQPYWIVEVEETRRP